MFSWGSTQEEVFEFGARAVVGDVMKGYNGTIFAYGQTGSGKTFTMQGPDLDDPQLKGLIPRIVETIFAEIESASEEIVFTVSVSYMEIYLEKIRDLLDRARTRVARLAPCSRALGARQPSRTTCRSTRTACAVCL